MHIVPSVFDYAIAALIVVFAVAEIVMIPLLRRRRVALYAYMSGYLWLLAMAVLMLWQSDARPWSLLYLGSPVSNAWWRLAIGGAAVAAYIVFMARQRASLIRPKALPAVARAMHAVEWMMPRTNAERWWCVELSIAAGVCEEIIFRGFAVALVAHFTGVPLAVIVSALAFGLGHAYQNPKAIVPTGLFGLAMNVLVLVSGSLLPAIAIHIFQDIVLTEIGGYAVRHASEA